MIAACPPCVNQCAMNRIERRDLKPTTSPTKPSPAAACCSQGINQSASRVRGPPARLRPITDEQSLVLLMAFLLEREETNPQGKGSHYGSIFIWSSPSAWLLPWSTTGGTVADLPSGFVGAIFSQLRLPDAARSLRRWLVIYLRQLAGRLRQFSRHFSRWTLVRTIAPVYQPASSWRHLL